MQALFAALLRFDLLPHGFRNRQLREAVASLCGLSLDDYGTGRMTYDLRRLRMRGLIERIPGTRRHRLTAEGVCVALAYHRTQERVLGPVRRASLRFGTGAPNGFDEPPSLCPAARRRWKAAQAVARSRSGCR